MAPSAWFSIGPRNHSQCLVRMDRGISSPPKAGHLVPYLACAPGVTVSPMEKKILIVVGDEYSELTQHANVLTCSQLLAELAAPGRWTGAETVIIGQGIEE